MKRYYLKNRASKEIVTATFDANEEGDWTILDFDGEQPYFGSKEELENLGAGTLRKAAIDGDVKEGSVMIGQIAGMLDSVKTCDQIIKDIMSETETVIVNLQKIGK